MLYAELLSQYLQSYVIFIVLWYKFSWQLTHLWLTTVPIWEPETRLFHFAWVCLQSWSVWMPSWPWGAPLTRWQLESQQWFRQHQHSGGWLVGGASVLSHQRWDQCWVMFQLLRGLELELLNLWKRFSSVLWLDSQTGREKIVKP